MGADGDDAVFVLARIGLAGTDEARDEEEDVDDDDEGAGGCMELFLRLLAPLLDGGGAMLMISFSVAGLSACESLEPYIIAQVLIL